MGQTSQYHLERMLPELYDLEEKKIFSADEIRSIIRRRTAFENALDNRGQEVQDYVRYCEYELRLDQLRKKRVDRLVKGDEAGQGQKKTGPSDYAGPRRIIYLLGRATKKYPRNVQLWQDYISFVSKLHRRSRSMSTPRLLGKILANAIQMNPLEPRFWVMAIRHEWQEVGHVEGGRALAQRAVRLLDDKSEVQPVLAQIWLAWIELELAWVDRVKQRRVVLGLPEAVKKSSSEDERPGSAGDQAGDQVILTLLDAAMSSCSRDWKMAMEIGNLVTRMRPKSDLEAKVRQVVKEGIIKWARADVHDIALVAVLRWPLDRFMMLHQAEESWTSDPDLVDVMKELMTGFEGVIKEGRTSVKPDYHSLLVTLSNVIKEEHLQRLLQHKIVQYGP